VGHITVLMHYWLQPYYHSLEKGNGKIQYKGDNLATRFEKYRFVSKISASNVVSSTPHLIRIHNVSGDRHWLHR
jgi:hypothetical protein